MEKDLTVFSLIFAAGMGSRMEGYNGNKTLLPLIPGENPYEGSVPILVNIINHLPEGPKALVINHKKEEVIEKTNQMDLEYFVQPELNGTGGALISAGDYFNNHDENIFIITMGDIPLVTKNTYHSLAQGLQDNAMMVLGFLPEDKKQYGVLEIIGKDVQRIIEWKYWSEFPAEKQTKLDICNSGIYAIRGKELSHYVEKLEQNPHKVFKKRNSQMIEVDEFFITDIVELMHNDGLKVGYTLAESENEVMGVDDPSSLEKAQVIYHSRIL